MSLSVGLKSGKELCIKAKKPFIPIHHMEARKSAPEAMGNDFRISRVEYILLFGHRCSDAADAGGH